MEECLFCRIVKGEIPSEKIYEDEKVYAFSDVDPKAPVHVLIVPKEHMADVTDPRAVALAGSLFSAVQAIAKQLGLEENGFRCVINTGTQGGQTVGHLHMHLLAGQRPRVAARLMVRNRPTAGQRKVNIRDARNKKTENCFHENSMQRGWL